jgi:o-succinylbenzoate---CoA ligase
MLIFCFFVKQKSFHKLMKLKILHNALPNQGLQYIETFVNQWNDDRDFIQVHTSGSTGTPKPITLLKSHMRRSAELTGQFFGLSSSSTLLCSLNPHYIAGKMMLVRALTLDCSVILTAPESPLDFPEELHVDFAALVPLQVQKIVDANPRALNRIHKLIIGGAPVSLQLEQALAQTQCEAYETFGMTETTSHIALRKLGSEQREPYTALRNIHFSQDQRGCLVIHAQELGISELVTNDLVELVDTTRFHWLGRADFVINSGGIKFHPEQLERKLSTAHFPFRFFIAGIPDERYGEVISLIVEADETPSIDFTHLLEGYEIPKHIFSIPKFRETATGKLNRFETLLALGITKG